METDQSPSNPEQVNAGHQQPKDEEMKEEGEKKVSIYIELAFQAYPVVGRSDI